MNPRQARRERREAERKAKKLELKKSRLAEQHPLSAIDEFPEIQPRWNPELEDEFPREVQIRNNAIADRISLQAGLPIPPPGPSPVFKTAEDIRQHLLARRKASQPEAVCVSHTEPDAPAPEIGFVSQNKPSRADINRRNAQKSTGPTSSDGKLASSRNSFRHGLASGQIIITGEDPAAFEALLQALLEEHQPATLSEELLIQEMATSHWLRQRAIRLQNSCFGEEGVDQKGLALYLRYASTYERAFYKALNTLLKLKKTPRHSQVGFVSQTMMSAESNSVKNVPEAGFVSHSDPGNSREEEFVRQNTPASALEGGLQAA